MPPKYRYQRRTPTREPSQFQQQPPAAKQPTTRAREIKGDAALWQTMQIVRDPNSETTKTTRAMTAPTGVIVNTCTRGPGGMCEALVYVPDAKLMKREDGTVSISYKFGRDDARP